jgi:hypothetical protein
MHESRLHAWDRGRETARADDHRARHRAQALDHAGTRVTTSASRPVS